MPRLAPSLLHHAWRKNLLLPLLLRECRDTRSADNELRWLTEHAFALQFPADARTQFHQRNDIASAPGWRTTLRKLVRRRSKGEPLQYILGTQPFGDLEILCRKGVLIPRAETEAYTIKLAELVQDLRMEETAAKRQKLRILDVCTGTGCISLLLHSLLRSPNVMDVSPKEGSDGLFPDTGLDILGIDISKTALELAKNNLDHNLELGHLHPSAKDNVSFVRADVLNRSVRNAIAHRDSAADSEHEISDNRLADLVPSTWDILVANPPYISPRHFSPGGTTTRSVRRWEPELALVPKPLTPPTSPILTPPEHKQQCQSNEVERGDEFYPPLLELARVVDAKAVVLEVGGNEQALRVKEMATHGFAGEADFAVEIWRDDGTVDVANSDCACNGLGSECRAVVVWRSFGATWRMRTMNTQKQRI